MHHACGQEMQSRSRNIFDPCFSPPNSFLWHKDRYSICTKAVQIPRILQNDLGASALGKFVVTKFTAVS